MTGIKKIDMEIEKEIDMEILERSQSQVPEKDVLILGIESSCDETAAAVVKNGRVILSNVIASQAELHKQYGGVVPEIASRKHVEAILPVIRQALSDAEVTLSELDAVAVTKGPGLVGALLVGVSAAKGLAWAAHKPLIGVQHIAGHIAANYLADQDLQPPFLCLVVSGAHSHLVRVHVDQSYEVLAKTRDDAAGEAFDKIARAMGLGYPGGPLIDAAAKGGKTNAIPLPQTHFQDSLDFSFSGLKTAALNQMNQLSQKAAKNNQTWQDVVSVNDFAASFQQAIVDVLVNHTFAAIRKYGDKKLVLAGGVAANSRLRTCMQKQADIHNIKLTVPPLILCTDNAAMIAAAGYFDYLNGLEADLSLNASASLPLF